MSGFSDNKQKDSLPVSMDDQIFTHIKKFKIKIAKINLISNLNFIESVKRWYRSERKKKKPLNIFAADMQRI